MTNLYSCEAPFVVGSSWNVEPLVTFAVTPRRLLVVWREEVAAAALMQVDPCRYVEQELDHRRVLVHDRHVQHVLASQSYIPDYGGRAFAVAGPTVWKSLPDFIRDPSISIDSFRRLLKTYLFAQYYSACSALEVDNFMRYINLLTYLLTYLLCTMTLCMRAHLNRQQNVGATDAAVSAVTLSPPTNMHDALESMPTVWNPRSHPQNRKYLTYHNAVRWGSSYGHRQHEN